MKPVAIWSRLLSTVTFLFALPAFAAQPGDQDLSLHVQLRPSVTADIEAQVLVNPNHPSGGRTFVLLHGLAHAGNAFRPLTEAVFADHELKASRVVLLSLPGHGGSSLPQGISFGELSLDDDVATLIGALDALGALGLHADVLAGHSLGAEIVALTQNRLIAEGTNLRTRFAVDDVVLLAPAIPNPLPWANADHGTGAMILGSFVRTDPILGSHVSIPAEVWLALFFTNTKGDFAPGTPSADEVVDQGYIAPEALVAGLQLLGAGGFMRPTVSAGVFERHQPHRSDACVIAFSEDLFITVEEERAFYRYLTGDAQDRRFVVVTRSDAVHDTPIADPDTVANAMEACLK